MVAVKSLVALASFFLSTPSVVPAHPLQSVWDQPTGTARLGLDASGNIARKISGSTVATQKRDNGPCSNLSVDDAKKLPGWKAIEDYANMNWGTGKRRIVTNDKDEPDLPAQICVDKDSVTVQKNGNPQCNTVQQSAEGTLVGSSGTVQLSTTDGTGYSSQSTVTKESSIATGVTVSAGFPLANLFDIGADVSTQTSFTNTLSDTKSVSYNATAGAAITMTAPEGQTCHLTFNNQVCTVQGTGKVRFTATGWVFFEYEDKVQDHYKWAVEIAQAIPNIEDRSSYAEFQTDAQTEMKTNYQGTCSK